MANRNDNACFLRSTSVRSPYQMPPPAAAGVGAGAGADEGAVARWRAGWWLYLQPLPLLQLWS